MTFDVERLLDLLPDIYRARPILDRADAGDGAPLRGLLGLIAREIGVVEEDLERLYDDQFVETSADWVLPYHADALGITGLPKEPLAPRAEVAHTIGYRRRKGTASMLEQLARDVTGLPARAVEFFEIVATTQYLNHLRRANLSFLSVRDASRLEALGGAFEHLAGSADLTHTVDVRRIGGRRGRGRYNVPNVGIFLWRLGSYPLTRTPMVEGDGPAGQTFRFNPLGIDAPLFGLPRTEVDATGLARPENVPVPLSRRAMRDRREAEYGWSVRLEIPATPSDPDPIPVPLADIVICNLAGWNLPSAGKVAIDPDLGRIAFASPPAAPPLATFHSGAAGDIGGGEYRRPPAAEDPGVAVKRVARTGAPFTTVQAAIAALGPEGGIVEIMDSSRYTGESLELDASGRHVVVRARDGSRPTIVLAPASSVADANRLTGNPSGSITIDGLLIVGRTLRVVRSSPTGDGPGSITFRHCTLVPGTDYASTGASPLTGTSVAVTSVGTLLSLESCITGAIQVELDAQARIRDSIVDATSEVRTAYAAASDDFGGRIWIEDSTVIGRIKTDAVERGSNTIFLAALGAPNPKWTAPIVVRRRQQGCIRFSYVPLGSSTPRRYRCQPTGQLEADRVRPMFTSVRYGEPAYGQLHTECPVEISRGADDESEMGAFHGLRMPLRDAHLRARLDEYLRFGLEAGVFYAS